MGGITQSRLHQTSRMKAATSTLESTKCSLVREVVRSAKSQIIKRQSKFLATFEAVSSAFLKNAWESGLGFTEDFLSYLRV